MGFRQLDHSVVARQPARHITWLRRGWLDLFEELCCVLPRLREYAEGAAVPADSRRGNSSLVSRHDGSREQGVEARREACACQYFAVSGI